MAASASEIEKVYHCMCVHMPFTATCCMHDVLLFNFHSRLAPLTSTGSHHLLASVPKSLPVVHLLSCLGSGIAPLIMAWQ